jgi:hypothetical protein
MREEDAHARKRSVSYDGVEHRSQEPTLLHCQSSLRLLMRATYVAAKSECSPT